MLADNLTGIHLVVRLDEETAAVLQLVQRVGIGLASFHRDKGTGVTTRNFALPRLEFDETVRDDGLAFRGGQQLVGQPDQSA